MTFQDLILALQDYWSRQGCVVLQPYDMEVGAGTFHPATFLRSIGPEPWRTAYVQPSRRPTDGRYGENPNRLRRHHQFQVHGFGVFRVLFDHEAHPVYNHLVQAKNLFPVVENMPVDRLEVMA